MNNPNPVAKSASAEIGQPVRRPGIFAQAVTIAVTLVACLFMLEIGLRIIHRYPMDNAEGYHAAGGLSYVLKKNITKEVVWPTMSFTVHTSDLGFRVPQPGHQVIGERPYYVVLGASDSFGNGLNYNDTFVGVFAEKMRKHNIDVVNMSVAGHHLLEQAHLFKEFAATAPKAPTAVLIFFNPNLIGGYDDNHTNVVVRRGDLFDKEHWKVALARKTLANTSTIYCFFRDGIRKIQQKFIGREDFSLSFYIDRFSTQHPIRTPEKTADFDSKLKDITDFIRSLNAKPIYVYCPPSGGFFLNDLASKGKVDRSLFDTQFFADIVQKHCQKEGVEFLDLAPPVQKRYDSGEKLNFDGDGHYNGPTSRIVGEYLYSSLRPDRG